MRINRLAVKLIGIACLVSLTTSCTNGVATPKASPKLDSDKAGFMGYEIPWTMDQIASFNSPLRLVGTVKRISLQKGEAANGLTYDYTDYELVVEQGEGVSAGENFTARQADLHLRNVGGKSIKVGDRVIYLGSLASADSKGIVRGVADWLIELQDDGYLDYGDPGERPKFKDFAKKLKLKETR